MPSTCRPWSPCATIQTSSRGMKSSGRPERPQRWRSPPSCESSSSSQTPSSETSAAGPIKWLDQHGYSNGPRGRPGPLSRRAAGRGTQTTTKRNSSLHSELAEQALEVVQFDLGPVALAAAAAQFVQDLPRPLQDRLVRDLDAVSRLQIAAAAALAAKRVALALAGCPHARTFTFLPAKLLGKVLEKRLHSLLQMIQRIPLGAQRLA